MKTINFIFLIYCMVCSSMLYAQKMSPVGIKEIHIGDSIISFTSLTPDSITLKPDDDDLSIYFVDTFSVDFYKIELQGFDKAPIFLQYPTTRYTNLTGGDYVFTLSIIKNADTSEVTRLAIKVLPKTTEAFWFIPSLVLYVSLVVFALFFLGLMYHYRQKMRMQKIRNQIAGDLHDEVGSTLSSIAIFSKALKRDMANKDSQAISTLDNIIQSAEQTNSNLHDTVWSLNPEYDTVEDLFEKIRSDAYQLFTAKNIQLKFDTDLAVAKDINISMFHRRNVYLMTCEAINNILKHSQATQVSISIKKENRKIRLMIQDNGNGFDIDSEKGNGLKNFQRRAQESFIKFNLESQPNNGTSISMLIPQL